jgi:hypothetical protein
MSVGNSPDESFDRVRSGLSVRLPDFDGRVYTLDLSEGVKIDAPHERAATPSRVFYAAPHVVADAMSGGDGRTDLVDWESTLAFRRHLWSHGLGVAEAMDTAQRGMGLPWSSTQELIRLTSAEASGQLLACGASTDQLDPDLPTTLDKIVGAYIEQCNFIEGLGGTPVIMASRLLALAAASRDDYVKVYGRILAQVEGPVMLHWLGDAFDPQLSGYWGSTALDSAADALLEIIELEPTKIEGVKISILDAERERNLRARMPPGVRVYTGDDYNYAELIRGDEFGHSDALLGVFNPLAVQADAALGALDNNDLDAFDRILGPTLPLAHRLFAAPTANYKTGVVFLAYLNGHQDHFRMLQGMDSARSLPHLADIVRLADQAGVLENIDLAAQRIKLMMAAHGIDS